MERECRLAGVRTDVFGSAAAAIRSHSIKPCPTPMAGAAGARGLDASFMAQFDAHFTALSEATAGSNVMQGPSPQPCVEQNFDGGPVI